MTNHLDYPEGKDTIHVLTHRYDLSERETENKRYVPVQSMTGILKGFDAEVNELILENKDGERLHVQGGNTDHKLFQEANRVLQDCVVTVGVYNEGKQTSIGGHDIKGKQYILDQNYDSPAIPRDLMDFVLVNGDDKDKKITGTLKAVHSDRLLEVKGEEGTPNKLVYLERNERYSKKSLTKMLDKSVEIGTTRLGGLYISTGGLKS